MEIRRVYSHLNGHEYLLVHQPDLWAEIEAAIAAVDADSVRLKVSREKTKAGNLLFDPRRLNQLFKKEFNQRGWQESRVSYLVGETEGAIRQTILLRSRAEQQARLDQLGEASFSTYNQIDFIKDGVAIEVQLGKYFAVQYDLHVKHTFFFGRGDINVGIEIVPTHTLMRQMSSGVAWFENELANIIREGRSNPAVPLVLIGIEP